MFLLSALIFSGIGCCIGYNTGLFLQYRVEALLDRCEKLNIIKFSQLDEQQKYLVKMELCEILINYNSDVIFWHNLLLKDDTYFLTYYNENLKDLLYEKLERPAEVKSVILRK